MLETLKAALGLTVVTEAFDGRLRVFVLDVRRGRGVGEATVSGGNRHGYFLVANGTGPSTSKQRVAVLISGVLA